MHNKKINYIKILFNAINNYYNVLLTSPNVAMDNRNIFPAVILMT